MDQKDTNYLMGNGLTAYPKNPTFSGYQEIDGAWLLRVVRVVHFKKEVIILQSNFLCVSNLLGEVKRIMDFDIFAAG